MRFIAVLFLVISPALVCAEPVKVCEAPDGKLKIRVYSNEILQLPADQRPVPAGYTCFDADRSDIPDDRSRREAWRRKSNGKVQADPNIETPAEARKKRQDATKKKLKDLGLSDDDLKELFRDASRNP